MRWRTRVWARWPWLSSLRWPAAVVVVVVSGAAGDHQWRLGLPQLRVGGISLADAVGAAVGAGVASAVIRSRAFTGATRPADRLLRWEGWSRHDLGAHRRAGAGGLALLLREPFGRWRVRQQGA